MPDLGSDSIADSAATTKAIATGDPRYLRQVELSAAVDELQSEADAHFAEQRSIEREREALRWQVPAGAERLAALETAVPALTRWAGDRDSFSIVIDDHTHTDRRVAARALREALRKQSVLLKHDAGITRPVVIGNVAGYAIEVARPAGADFVRLQFSDLPLQHKTIGLDELYTSTPGASAEGSQQEANGLLRRLENMAGDAPAAVDSAAWALQQATQRLDQLEAAHAHDFPRARELDDMSKELGQLQQELREAETSPEALTAAAERADRLARNGREPGWSLMLNPTPQLIADLGCDTADQVRDIMLDRRQVAHTEYQLLNHIDSSDGQHNTPSNGAIREHHLEHLSELERQRQRTTAENEHHQQHQTPPAGERPPRPHL